MNKIIKKIDNYINESINNSWFFDKPTKDGYYFVLNINERNGKLENNGNPHLVEVFKNGKAIKTDIGAKNIDEYLGIGTFQGGPRIWNGPFFPSKNIPSTKEINDYLKKYKEDNPERYE